MTRPIYRPPWRIDLDVRDGVRSPLGGATLGRVVAAALEAAGAPAPASIGLILADDAELAGLNATHMGKDGPTDVLSFPLVPPEVFPPHPGRTTAPGAGAPFFALAAGPPAASRRHRRVRRAGDRTGGVGPWRPHRRRPLVRRRRVAAARDPWRPARLRLGPRRARRGGRDAGAGAPAPGVATVDAIGATVAVPGRRRTDDASDPVPGVAPRARRSLRHSASSTPALTDAPAMRPSSARSAIRAANRRASSQASSTARRTPRPRTIPRPRRSVRRSPKPARTSTCCPSPATGLPAATSASPSTSPSSPGSRTRPSCRRPWRTRAVRWKLAGWGQCRPAIVLAGSQPGDLDPRPDAPGPRR